MFELCESRALTAAQLCLYEDAVQGEAQCVQDGCTVSLWALRAPTPLVLLGPLLQLPDPKAPLKACLFCFCLNQMHPYKKNLKKTLDQDPKYGPKILFFQAYRSTDSGMSPILTFMRVTIWLTDHQLCGGYFHCRGNTPWCPVGCGQDFHICALVAPPVRREHQNGAPSRAERKDLVFSGHLLDAASK